MFISDHILKSLADDFARNRGGQASVRRRPSRIRAWLIGKLTRARTQQPGSAATVQAKQNQRVEVS